MIYSVSTNKDNISKLYVAGRLEWTTEPPTQEGWYWVKMNYEDPEIQIQIKHLGKGDPPRWLNNVTHWLGPLPQPERP